MTRFIRLSLVGLVVETRVSFMFKCYVLITYYYCSRFHLWLAVVSRSLCSAIDDLWFMDRQSIVCRRHNARLFLAYLVESLLATMTTVQVQNSLRLCEVDMDTVRRCLR